MRGLALVVATAAYSGHVPVAPGTAGSLVGLAVFALVRALGGPAIEVVTIIALVAAGIWAASEAERHFGRSDPGAIVIDEVAGMLVTLCWLPVSWGGALIGFLAFRAFDIVKPFPARAAERLPRGWGVMADDIVAGVYAHIVLRLLAWAVPVWVFA